MVILTWLADEFAAPMVCHLHAFASACESGAVRAGEVIDSEHDQPLLAPQAITVNGEAPRRPSRSGLCRLAGTTFPAALGWA